LGNFTHRELPAVKNRQLDALKVASLSQPGLSLLGRPNMFQLCSHNDPGVAEQLR